MTTIEVDPAAGPGTEPPAALPGRVRIEFTSPAKPALITWASEQIGAGGAAGQDSADSQDTPAFRYLVVPLRVPART